jgi:hypothetical protein
MLYKFTACSGQRGWLPKFAGGKLVVLGKWMIDVHSRNRFDSNYSTLTIAWTF